MIVAGIDVGGKNLHIIIKKDGRILGKTAGATGIKKAEAVERFYDEALKKAGLTRRDVERVVATGSSAKRVTFANGFIPDAVADACGANRLLPSARTVIDVGAEEGRAIKISPEGNVLDFAIHGKCAAGTGMFLQAMAKVMQVNLEQMAEYSLKAKNKADISGTCAVFAESEVISHIHRVPPTPKEEIIAGIHASMVSRVMGLLKRLGITREVALVGGVARNKGLVDILEKELGFKVRVPENPELVAALGAAILAKENLEKENK